MAKIEELAVRAADTADRYGHANLVVRAAPFRAGDHHATAAAPVGVRECSVLSGGGVPTWKAHLPNKRFRIKPKLSERSTTVVHFLTAAQVPE